MSLRRLATVCSAAAVLATLAPAGPAAEARGCFSFKQAERAFARRINRARARHGKRHLRLDPQLSRVARKHSWEMQRAGNLFHQTYSQLRRRVTRWSSIAENVGVGYGVRRLHRAFMASSGHRANILGRYRHVGIAVVTKGPRLWVTVVFEAWRDPGTRLDMPRC